MSGIEMGEMGRYIKHRDFSRVLVADIQQHSGILVSTKESWEMYIGKVMDALKGSDRLAIWDGGCYTQCQDMYDECKKQMAGKTTMPAHCLEPYYFMEESTYEFPNIFEKQKILIVTSHAESVKYQIDHHIDSIFYPHSMFGTSCTFQVYKTVQQNGNCSDGREWHYHLDKMCHDISTIEFDVAFIGCGGFSNLLGHFIRDKMHKSAIYVGGPLQLYFGIIGRRWLDNTRIRQIVERNGKNWICPMTEDYIPGCTAVDQSCYWI